MLKAVLVFILNILMIFVWINIPVAYGGGGDFSLLVERMGLSHMSEDDRSFIFVFALLYFSVFSLLADQLLGKAGVGAALYGTASSIAVGVAFTFVYKTHGSFQLNDIELIVLLILFPPFVAVLCLAVLGAVFNLAVGLILQTGKVESGKKLYLPQDGGPSQRRLRTAGRQKP